MVERTRVIFPPDMYDEMKDEIKAPFKAHALKWQFLGQGKGRYHKTGATVFFQYTESGADYTVWGEDAATVDAILDAWRVLVGHARFDKLLQAGKDEAEGEEAEAESEAMRLWRLQEPQRRPGEPDIFFEKRKAAWEAAKPGS